MSEQLTVVSVRTDVVEKMVELERAYLAAEKAAKDSPRDGALEFRSISALGETIGFMAALKFFMPTESIGLMVYQRMCLMEGEGSDD